MSFKRKLLAEYRRYFQTPDSIADAVVMARIITFVILFLLLGIATGSAIHFFTS